MNGWRWEVAVVMVVEGNNNRIPRLDAYFFLHFCHNQKWYYYMSRLGFLGDTVLMKMLLLAARACCRLKISCIRFLKNCLLYSTIILINSLTSIFSLLITLSRCYLFMTALSQYRVQWVELLDILLSRPCYTSSSAVFNIEMCGAFNIMYLLL